MRGKSIALSGLAVVALLAPAAATVAAAPAATASPAFSRLCYPDTCDLVTEYYSDDSHTTLVGEHEDGVCGSLDWGDVTAYTATVQDHCP